MTVPPIMEDGLMAESYDLVVIDLPDSEEQIYVRTWETGEVDVDYRANHHATWTPIKLLGGSFHEERSA